MNDNPPLLYTYNGDDFYTLDMWQAWLCQYSDVIMSMLGNMEYEVKYQGSAKLDYEHFRNLWNGVRALGERMDYIQYVSDHNGK